MTKMMIKGIQRFERVGGSVKRGLFSLLAFVFLSLFCFVTSETQAQSASDIASSFVAAVKSSSAVEIGYSFEAKNGRGEVVSSSRGSVYSQGKAYRAVNDITEFYCDGATKWIHNIESGELIISNVSGSASSVADNPVAFLTSFDKGYKYGVVSQRSVAGKRINVATLTPSDKKMPYSKILVGVDASKNTPAFVEYYSKDGSVYTVLVSSFAKKDGGWARDFFTFPASKIKGLDVTDLR